MSGGARSPRIERLSWGRVHVNGYRPFKDAKVYPGGARAWDWEETGTGHESGIQPSDVEELLGHGAEVIVIATGIFGRLRVHPDTLRLLEERGVATHIFKTDEAVRLYNEMRETEPVGGLFHSTC
jgi:hypothetical protein